MPTLTEYLAVSALRYLAATVLVSVGLAILFAALLATASLFGWSLFDIFPSLERR